jgi:outer membrane protein TolC
VSGARRGTRAPTLLAALVVTLFGATLGCRTAAAQEPTAGQDAGGGPIPTITLGEALSRASGLDPNYVSALRQVGDADWVRRSAWSAFLLPQLDFQWSWQRYSSPSFNIGTGEFTDKLTQFSLSASYAAFRGGARIFDLQAANAGKDRSTAEEARQRFQTALQTEADYYDVIAQRELARVADERVRRAEEQLAVARARVLTGAAVQTDSLQLLLELTRAQVDQLRQKAALSVSRLQLGRRIGVSGAVDAAELDTLPSTALPISETEAVAEAASRSPRVQVARAEARRTDALFKSERSSYLPSVDLFARWVGFSDQLIPDATKRSSVGISLSFPIWDGAQRELRVYRANTARKVAEAARADEELAVARDMTEAYETYTTARASTRLAERGVIVARENLRVQEERYRAGATTIIDLITAQVNLAEADAGLVQARFASRLALAGVEAILGRRLYEK